MPGVFGRFDNTQNQSVIARNIGLLPSTAPASDATAGNITYTVAQFLGGIIVRDPNGAGRTDTLPTAAALVAAIPKVAVGEVRYCTLINGADAAEAITLSAGTGGSFDANQTASSRVCPQNSQKQIYVRFTNVTPGSEAYVVYF